MTSFIAGALTGAVVAVFAMVLVRRGTLDDDEIAGTKTEYARLNSEKKERQEWLKEQNRQHDNMMNYTGKDQRS